MENSKKFCTFFGFLSVYEKENDVYHTLSFSEDEFEDIIQDVELWLNVEYIIPDVKNRPNMYSIYEHLARTLYPFEEIHYRPKFNKGRSSSIDTQVANFDKNISKFLDAFYPRGDTPEKAKQREFYKKKLSGIISLCSDLPNLINRY